MLLCDVFDLYGGDEEKPDVFNPPHSFISFSFLITELQINHVMPTK